MEKFICYGCFHERVSPMGPCPYCGYDPKVNRKAYPFALAGGAILNGRYIIGQTLGQGGFGITYLAQEYRTKELFAIKEFFPETMVTRTDGHTITAFSGQREEMFRYGMECFLAEAETLAQFIGMEHIVRVYSYFEENGTAYFVMDYIDGKSLQEYLSQHGGKITWEETKQLLFPVMDALSMIHSRGIIHRDIAPDNIFITADGVVKLLDFGSARYSLGDKSRSLDVVLKHGYAPMEQYTRRGRQGPFTDVYSMAATIYHCITGHLLPDAVERMEEDLLALPSSFGIRIPEDAENALEKALSVRAADRYQSMAEFRSALGELEAERREAEQKKKDEPLALTQLEPELEIDLEDDIFSPKKQVKRLGIAAVVGAVLGIALGVYLYVPKEVLPERISLDTVRTSIAEISTVETAPTSPTETEVIPATEPGPDVLHLEIRKAPFATSVAAALDHAVGLKADGTVVTVGSNGYFQCEVEDWEDIVAVSANRYCTMGLKADGTVVAAGQYAKREKIIWSDKVQNWRNMVSIATGEDHVVGLKNDGTVVASGVDNAGECQVKKWKDIVAIAAGSRCTIGLKSDGTVVTAGFDDGTLAEMGQWKDIVAITANAGLKSDGTVVAAGVDAQIQKKVESWTDIVAIAGTGYVLGLKADGTVVTTAESIYECSKVEEWTNIVDVAGSYNYTVGIRSDGTAVVTKSASIAGAKNWTGLMVLE